MIFLSSAPPASLFATCLAVARDSKEGRSATVPVVSEIEIVNRNETWIRIHCTGTGTIAVH